jgi:uncharacterized protein YdeI (YjbR/CyaY-like superfamily)
VKKFKGRIAKEGSGLGWKIVDIPFDVKKVFGKAGRLPVSGKVNGFPFRTSLFPRKGDPHFLMLNKTMQKGAGVGAIGDLVSVELEHDYEERIVTTPPMLKEALSEEEGLLEYFEKLNYSTRKWIVESVLSPKSPAVRKRRAEQLAVQIYEMKAGETEPPPILQAVFARNPLAKKGWEKSSASMKRGHLWGIFYYKTPEARQKRLEKSIVALVAQAKKNV